MQRSFAAADGEGNGEKNLFESWYQNVGVNSRHTYKHDL